MLKDYLNKNDQNDILNKMAPLLFKDAAQLNLLVN